MALTYSPESELGRKMPSFELPTVFGETFKSESINASKAKVIAFICSHCPYVQAIEDRLVQLGNDLKNKHIDFVAICSNDSSDYPEDAPEALKERAEQKSYTFPYLIDQSQSVAKEFDAVCTPDFFIFDENNRLAYRGRLDDSWKNENNVSHRELYEAAVHIAEKKKIDFEMRPTMGCSIKWK